MRVLMGTDGSVHASGAMLAAGRLLRKVDANVDILCVAPMLPQRSNRSEAQSQRHTAYKEKVASPYRRVLEDAQRILALSHLKTDARLEYGSPAEKLLELSTDYDLTVVGAYGGHDRKQPGLGPVSSRLLQMSGGNVFVGRELTNEDNFRVLVAMDGSDASFRALRTLNTLFDISSLDVTLMHVVETPWAQPRHMAGEDRDSAELSEYPAELEQELRLVADDVMQRAQRQIEAWSMPSTTIVEEGDPALELASHAEEGGYDLIVAGATGVSDVKHALLGSVSLKLAWNAPCSVAVIRG